MVSSPLSILFSHLWIVQMCKVSDLTKYFRNNYTMQNGTAVPCFLFWMVYFSLQILRTKSLLEQLCPVRIHFNYVFIQPESSVSFPPSTIRKLNFGIQAQNLTFTLGPSDSSVQSIVIPRDQRPHTEFIGPFYKCLFSTQFEMLLQALRIHWSTGHILSCMNGTYSSSRVNSH